MFDVGWSRAPECGSSAAEGLSTDGLEQKGGKDSSRRFNRSVGDRLLQDPQGMSLRKIKQGDNVAS